MKKFCLKLSIILLLFIVLNILYKNTRFYRSENEMNVFENIPYELELANLGSSHGLYGIKYDSVPEINAHNFALKMQPYFYDYAILKKYVNHFSKEAVILIPVSYFNVLGHFDYSNFRKRYYRILGKKEMDFWSFKEDLIYSKFPILIAGTDLLHIVNDISKEESSPYYERTSYLESDTLHKFCKDRYDALTAEEFNKGEEGYKRNLISVSKIIDFCYLNNLIPVIITTPINEYLNSLYEEDGIFIPSYERFTSDLCKKYPDLLYLDYSHDIRFSTHNELFADGDHLNNNGAELFTKIIIEDLRKKELLK